MDRYKIKITRQAKEHLLLIREYIATELSEPALAKRVPYRHVEPYYISTPGIAC